jgi:tyrosinase
MLDRRAFLVAGGSQLALLGGVAPSQAQSSATVTRRSIRGMSWNGRELTALRRAVARLKALPRSAPRNWTTFADIHREHCPHGNWYFLPWHRAYIRSFERICQEFSGDPGFALPYWDWTANRRFPVAFEAGDSSTNPLDHARPGITRDFQLDDDMVGARVISRIMASPDFEAFGNTRPRGQNNTSAQWQHGAGSTTELEFNPHNGVHQAIGGNMATPPLAARDPAFFVHHANIDRLWSTWNARGNANTTEPMWRDFAFSRQFIRPDGAPWNVGVVELGTPSSLGYRYDDDDSPFAADLVRPLGDLMTYKLRAYRELSARWDWFGASPHRVAVRGHYPCRGRRERPGRLARPADPDLCAARANARRDPRPASLCFPARPPRDEAVPPIRLGGVA